MSFQAYLDTVKTKTGKTPEDFKKLAEKKGLLEPGMKAGPVLAWLKEEFELGHGHAMAVFATLKATVNPKTTRDEALDKHFSGAKAVWREAFEGLLAKLGKQGAVHIAPTSTYLSLLKDNKKFGIVQITKERMDIGIKLKDEVPTERLLPSGSWNTMVTHRVQVHSAKEIDKELLAWLSDAYRKA